MTYPTGLSLIKILTEQEERETPKLIIMAGAPGAGKTHLLEQLDTKELTQLNPDKYTEDEDHPAYKNLSAAVALTNKEAEKLIEDRKSFVWDTTAANTDKVKGIKKSGYHLYMIMVYTHPMISYIQNFGRERQLSSDVVINEWVRVYQNIGTYRKLLKGNLSVYVNLREGRFDSQIKAFNSAAQKGPKSLAKFLQDYNEEHSIGSSTYRQDIELDEVQEKVYDIVLKKLFKVLPDFNPENYSENRAVKKVIFDAGTVNTQDARATDKLVKKMVTAVKAKRRESVRRADKVNISYKQIAKMLADKNFREIIATETPSQIQSKINSFLK